MRSTIPGFLLAFGAAAVLLLTLGGATADGASGTTGDVTGTVTDDTGAPVWRACVSAHETPDAPHLAITTTATDGTYTLADLDPGDVHIRATDCLRSQLATIWAETTVVATTSVTVDAEMAFVGAGMLRATTTPAVPSQIRVDGAPTDDWGLTWVQVPAGRHEVAYTDIPGLAEAEPTVVTVYEGQTTTVDSANPATGFLRVTTDPPVPSTIEIDGFHANDWGVWTELPVGEYGVCFGAVPGFREPSCTGVDVLEGQTTTFTGEFTPGAPLEEIPRHGMLRVTTNPPVPSRITVDGFQHDTWGLTWVKVEPGLHSVEFSDVPGFATPEPVVVEVHEGETTTVDGLFDRLGSLRVTTSPASPATIYVDGLPANDWGVWTHATPGDHLVCAGTAPGFVPPPCEVVTVTAGELSQIEMASVGPDSAAPAAPGGLGAEPLHAAVALYWDRSPERDLAGYHVDDTTGGGRVRLTDAPVTDPEYLHSGVPNGTDRTYEVTAIDLHGNESVPATTGTVTPAAVAITEHCGDITTSETWDAASVHVLTCRVVVAVGATLTIDPGAVVKIPPPTPPGTPNALIQVDGGLDVNGTPVDPVVVTRTTDDSAAGDTNGDADVTVPLAPPTFESFLFGLANSGDVDIAETEMRWGSIAAGGSNGTIAIRDSHLQHAGMIYLGGTGPITVTGNTIENTGPDDYSWTGICILRDGDSDTSTPVTVTDNHVRGARTGPSTGPDSDCEGHGISVLLTDQSSPDPPTVAGNHVDDVEREAIEVVSSRLDLGRLSDNSAGGNSVRVLSLSGTIVADGTTGAGELPIAIGEGLNPFDSTLVVDEGVTLTMDAGSVLLSLGSFLRVDGYLDVNGTEQQPVVFAPITDDRVLGDTDRNGIRPLRPEDGGGGIRVTETATGLSVDRAAMFWTGGIVAAGDFDPATAFGDVEIRNSVLELGAISVDQWRGSVSVVDNTLANPAWAGFTSGICIDHRGLDGSTTSLVVSGNDVSGAFDDGSSVYRDCEGRGIDVRVAPGSTIGPIVAENHVRFTDDAAIAVWADSLDPANLTGNTQEDAEFAAIVIGGTIVADLDLPFAGELPLVPGEFPSDGDPDGTGYVTVASGVTMTVGAGAALASLGPGWLIEGTLDVDGTGGAPAVFDRHPKLVGDAVWRGLRFVDGGVGDLVGAAIHNASVALTIDDGAEVTFRGEITGNEFGVVGCADSSSCVADVTNTDWGTPTGPAPFGSGDEVSGHVEVEPWVGQATAAG